MLVGEGNVVFLNASVELAKSYFHLFWGNDGDVVTYLGVVYNCFEGKDRKSNLSRSQTGHSK